MRIWTFRLEVNKKFRGNGSSATQMVNTELLQFHCNYFVYFTPFVLVPPYYIWRLVAWKLVVEVITICDIIVDSLSANSTLMI
jgi:hypothetical protein